MTNVPSEKTEAQTTLYVLMGVAFLFLLATLALLFLGFTLPLDKADSLAQRAMFLGMSAVSMGAALFTGSLVEENKGNNALRIVSVVLMVAGILVSFQQMSVVWSIPPS